ncbi:hypothetical protein PPERSA_09972 [Pseudocohnilembus persalinus]|uniref:Uncharacterized protein n=1 Tax=Pseudocohnilembus persalinus TaxID=266149 RepID=A0A0V0QJ67_PSEPJ|nr:hypothetical protein PPERSA_09972 [Pseudocohnilembus persalinus]|eukprot:KRX02355.1 hypothetical protein PPERSA_09972 [Pseudocohnilembus persalinus]
MAKYQVNKARENGKNIEQTQQQKHLQKCSKNKKYLFQCLVCASKNKMKIYKQKSGIQQHLGSNYFRQNYKQIPIEANENQIKPNNKGRPENIKKPDSSSLIQKGIQENIIENVNKGEFRLKDPTVEFLINPEIKQIQGLIMQFGDPTQFKDQD